MKKLVLILAFALVLFAPAAVGASSDWRIESFDSNLQIQSDGRVLVNERLEVVYNIQKHGIFRDIPYVYQADEGTRHFTELAVQSVTRDGQPEKYEVITNDANIRIKIGDPDRTIAGQYRYQITYLATGILREFGDYDELYWNATGFWGVPIANVAVAVSLPRGGIVQAACYQGGYGESHPCEPDGVSPQSRDRVDFTAGPLEPQQNVTVAVGFTKGLVPILTGQKPVTFWDKFTAWPSLAALFGILAVGLAGIFRLWYSRGRDRWHRRDYGTDHEPVEEIKPLGGHTTVMAEYDPPDGMRPAEIGVLVDEKADTRDITATIIDLARRGYITIKEIAKKKFFGSADYELTKTKTKPNDLLPYEQQLFDSLFDESTTVLVSDLKDSFYTDLKKVKDKLYRGITDKKLFVANPDHIRSRYYVMAVLVMAVGGGLIFLGRDQLVPLTSSGIGLGVSGLVLLVFAKFMPARTAKGHDLYLKARGFELFMEKAEIYRERYHERENIFTELLPYAVMFGIAKKFAKAMKDIGVETAAPAWYIGTGHFDAGKFGNELDSFSSSLSSAMASTPSSSGSGGGGFSGGGFGGGGGGSW